MNTETFLANFHTIANAPGGIARLREMILQLAVQGKLVEQNPNDEPASELLKKIEAEKELTTKGTKNTKGGIEPIKDEDKPYKLPSNWVLCNLSNITQVLNGRAYKQQELLSSGKTPVLRVGNLFTSNHWYYSDLELEPDKYCEKGDLLYSWSASFGPFIWNGEKSIYHYHIWKLKFFSERLINKNYLYFFLLQKTEEIKASGHGISMIHMTKEKMEKLFFPLPPLAEQKRIVEKVDSLMALCDRLEELQKKKVELNSLTRKTAFSALGNANEPSELKAAWTRVEINTKYLLDSEEAVEEMKKTILQNAIKGNLVPQDPNDEPTSELLKKIEAEKESLTTKSAKNTKGGMEPIKDEDKPYKLPSNWEWVRLGLISQLKGGKRVDNGYTLLTAPTPYIYIRVTDMKNGSIDDSNLRYIDEKMHEKIKQYIISKDDLYMTIVGATIGKCGIVPDKFHNMNLTENAARIIIQKSIYRLYLFKTLYSPFCQKQFFNNIKQVGVQKMSLHRLSNTIIPLPPLAEQKRIVEKVDSLFALCDRLQKQLADAKTTAANMAKAAVESLTGIQSTEKEKMKAPKTELVSILRLSKAPTVKDKAPLSAILLKHKEFMSAKNLWVNSGMEIDQFYQQLKTEMANGWIVEPEKAYMKEIEESSKVFL